MPPLDWMEILKALADPSRLRLVKALISSEAMSVNDLSSALGLSQYNVSKHLRILRQAGVVDVHPVGTRRDYSIAQPFRTRLKKNGQILDFGCCTFRFDQLPE